MNINKIQVYDHKTEEYKTYEIGGFITTTEKRGYGNNRREAIKKHKILGIIQEMQQCNPKEWQEYGLVIGRPKYNACRKLLEHSQRVVVTGRAIFN